MIENSKGIKIVIVVFSILLILTAGVAAFDNIDKNRLHLPVNGSVGMIHISWMTPDFEELVDRSDLIIVGTVSDKYGAWNTEDGSKPPRYALVSTGISTYYEISGLEVLKGSAETVTVRAPGGTTGGYTTTAEPMQELEVGDTVLLFLTNNYDSEGNPITWYHIGFPTVFIKNGDGLFENEFYGEISIEEVEKEIENSKE
ncbi:hypothetical protein MmiHf6_13390 [Methanimicrococcus hongohii]|uniref:Uncharacterized protein n=1 Tax=Methanimicrococcus hongohii TaxID=3028295 RepID=A0AA96V0F1_9EURY|nr:hypothetical protein [Methanimicrococcus sp. Hf6]WNY24014.1 hypothetical protein MmiHf6_13390 [Methanimicrococcus sp. Hf6]